MTNTTTFNFNFKIITLNSKLIPKYNLILHFPKYKTLTHNFNKTLHSPKQLQNNKIKLNTLQPIKNLTYKINKLIYSYLIQ